jgi:cytochrome c2
VALAAAACAATATEPTATPPAGASAYQKCYSCHALEPGKNDLGGPTLHAVIGRKIASEPFDYSPALRAFAVANPVWTRDLIDRFAADPEQLVPGTTMLFHGISDPAERAALIDYLEHAGAQTKASERSLP